METARELNMRALGASPRRLAISRRALLLHAVSGAAALSLSACGAGQRVAQPAPTERASGVPGTATIGPTEVPTATRAITASATTAGQPTIGPNGHYTEIQITSGGERHLIPLDEIFAGGPP